MGGRGWAAGLAARGCQWANECGQDVGNNQCLGEWAAGRVDGYAELHINAWDCAAGILLVTEAGGQANDFFTPEGLTSGGLLVASASGLFAELHELMLEPAPG